MNSGMTAAEWNQRYPVGTLVRFRDASSDVHSLTRSEAWEIGGGVGVVAIEGKSGGVGLSFLTVVDPASVDGATRILLERLRQVSVEGYDAKHDDAHDDGDLLRAARAYLNSSDKRSTTADVWWPWEPSTFKPTNPIRDLEKAGAFIAAEIDRRLRAGDTA